MYDAASDLVALARGALGHILQDVRAVGSGEVAGAGDSVRVDKPGGGSVTQRQQAVACCSLELATQCVC